MHDSRASQTITDHSRRTAQARASVLLCATLLSACGGSSTDDRSGLSAAPSARQQPADAAATWTLAASENARFQVTGTRLTRYGVEGHWVERSFTDTDVECSNATYGDPIVGTVKECQIQGGAAPAAGGAVITVQAASEECEGRADLALNIKGTEVTRWRGILGNARDAAPQYQQLSYQHPNDFALADVEIAFVNDHWTPACNRNVRVANVAVQRVGGAVEQVALASTMSFSTGTWSDAEKCSGRSVQSEWLDCNGAFRFDGTGAPAPTPTPGERISASFEATPDNFTNPERGLHRDTIIVSSNHYGTISAAQSYAQVRAEGITVVRGVALLDRHRGGPLPAAALDELRAAFAHARTAGVKIWLLVAYNFPTWWNDPVTNVDPPLATVLGHLDQLKPVFEENQDVLAGLYNGFIGAWGEWHSSSTGLDKEPQRSQIYKKMHAVLPTTRMMTVRTFEQIDVLPGGHPNENNAHDQTYATRTGLTNQCYLVDKTDAGTYAWNEPVEPKKALLSAWTRFVPMVAETCQLDNPDRQDDCATLPAENERMHMSVMNGSFHEPTITKWKQQGCYKDITDRLGYRLQLTTASVAGTVAAGSALDVVFAIKNTGYAAPYNPRGLAVVLRSRDTGARYAMPILQERNDMLDPRRWYRESGEITVRAAPVVPADVPAGSYDVLLSLHDPMPSLSARPEYSIRLANKNIWEPNAGLNKLVSGVTVTR